MARAMGLLLIVCAPLTGFGQTVAFDPGTYLPPDPAFSLPIVIDCAGLDVKGVEVQISYDPQVVQLQAIAPGAWFTGSGQAHYFFDHTTAAPAGQLHFDGAVLAGTLSGTGELAVCHFTMVDFGMSPLDFQLLDVRGLANLDLGFGHSSGDRIILDPVVDMDLRSFGVIKATFR